MPSCATMCEVVMSLNFIAHIKAYILNQIDQKEQLGLKLRYFEVADFISEARRAESLRMIRMCPWFAEFTIYKKNKF